MGRDGEAPQGQEVILNKGKITFHKIIQDSQEFGSDNESEAWVEHMVSRAFFTFEVGGNVYPNLIVHLKHTVGSSYETGLLEVGSPVGYSGPFNLQEFRNAAEKYYRSLVGRGGAGINIQGPSNVRMRNNVLEKEMVFEFSVSKEGGW